MSTAYFLLTILLGDTKLIIDEDIPIFLNVGSLNTFGGNGIFNQIEEAFFKNKFINKLPSALSKRKNPIRRDELRSYLSLIHPFAITAISEIFFKEKLITRNLFAQNLTDIDNTLSRTESIVRLLNRFESKNSEKKNIADILFTIASNIKKQIEFVNQYQQADKKLSPNFSFLLIEFPERFLARLEILVYPDWYSASFLKSAQILQFGDIMVTTIKVFA